MGSNAKGERGNFGGRTGRAGGEGRLSLKENQDADRETLGDTPAESGQTLAFLALRKSGLVCKATRRTIHPSSCTPEIPNTMAPAERFVCARFYSTETEFCHKH